MPDKPDVLLSQQSEPYRATLEAIHALFPLAGLLKDGTGSRSDRRTGAVITGFHGLCERYDHEHAYDLLNLMFGRKRKS